MATGAERECHHLAAGQHGVLTHAQAVALGMSRCAISRRSAAGEWEAVLPGVYRVVPAERTWHQLLMAACLWVGTDAAVSHSAAAALLRWEGFEQDSIEISTTAKRGRGPEWLVCHRVRALPTAQVTRCAGIPVTTPDRTLVDLAGKLGAEDLERALDDVLRSGSASRARIGWTLGQMRRPGCALLRELLAQRGPEYRPPTELERRMLRLLRDAGFPMPVREYEVRAPGLSARIDFAYPDERVAVETDGYWSHSSRQDWQRDRTRRNALTVLRWTVFQVTWEDLQHRPGEILASLRDLLRFPQQDAQRNSAVPPGTPLTRG